MGTAEHISDLIVAQNGHILAECSSGQADEGPGLFTIEEMRLGIIDFVSDIADYGFVEDTMSGERAFIHYSSRGEVIPGSESRTLPIVRLNLSNRPFTTFQVDQVIRYMVGVDDYGRTAVNLWVPSDEYIRVKHQMQQHQWNIMLYYGSNLS